MSEDVVKFNKVTLGLAVTILLAVATLFVSGLLWAGKMTAQVEAQTIALTGLSVQVEKIDERVQAFGASRYTKDDARIDLNRVENALNNKCETVTLLLEAHAQRMDRIQSQINDLDRTLRNGAKP